MPDARSPGELAASFTLLEASPLGIVRHVERTARRQVARDSA